MRYNYRRNICKVCTGLSMPERCLNAIPILCIGKSMTRCLFRLDVKISITFLKFICFDITGTIEKALRQTFRLVPVISRFEKAPINRIIKTKILGCLKTCSVHHNNPVHSLWHRAIFKTPVYITEDTSSQNAYISVYIIQD